MDIILIMFLCVVWGGGGGKVGERMHHLHYIKKIQEKGLIYTFLFRFTSNLICCQGNFIFWSNLPTGFNQII